MRILHNANTHGMAFPVNKQMETATNSKVLNEFYHNYTAQNNALKGSGGETVFIPVFTVPKDSKVF